MPETKHKMHSVCGIDCNRRIKNFSCMVICDFEGTESQIFLEVQVSALVFQLLIIGIKVLRGFLRLRKQHDQEAVSV